MMGGFGVGLVLVRRGGFYGAGGHNGVTLIYDRGHIRRLR
jgi:hypothetical protein